MKNVLCFSVVVFSLFFASPAFSHCQVPCGIYDDHARVDSMLEAVRTVRIAVSQTNKLAGSDEPQAVNQRVRWVHTKEEHAQKIISTISDYFLTQRVKKSQEDYVERLTRHHDVMVAAMKVKQTSGVKEIDALQEAVEALLPYYPMREHTH